MKADTSSSNGIMEMQESAAALAWAEVAGLIEIHPNGSWRLTAFGQTRLLQLESEESNPALQPSPAPGGEFGAWQNT